MKTLLPISQSNLDKLPLGLARPSYDRSKLSAGIMHIGVGGFHRSHQAYYTDKLLAEPGNSQWGICGVGLREADRKIGEVLREQDYLYTLSIKHPDGSIENRVIGSLIDFMLASDDPGAVVARMASEETKIVSLTITEGGYLRNPADGEFDLQHPEVQYDLANPENPCMVFGYLAAALRRRRDAGLSPFTIQSCDNIQHNGAVARRMMLAFVQVQDPELAAWIEQKVAFPNAMVDRITPVTTPADLEYLQREFGLQDKWPVTCEPFCQWVIEDDFSHGRPAWETVGAQFVPDVTPYEKMKIRLLNAGHSVLGILGSIDGHSTIDDCIADPLFATYLRRFMDVEVTPVLDPVEGIDLEAYKASLIERFGNTHIKDNLARICLESSSKLPVFLIPTINENLAKGGSTEYGALVIGAWCFYSDKHTSKDGVPLEVVDEMKAELHAAAAGTRKDKLSFLRVRAVFGNLSENQAFTDEYVRTIDALYENPNIARLMQALLFGWE